MAVCDICNSPGMGKLVSANSMRTAVNMNGFNPYKLGLVSNTYSMLGISDDMAFDNWKQNIVDIDTTDWNVCGSCMNVLKRYI